MPKPPQEIVDRIESGEAQEGGDRRKPVPEGYYLLQILEGVEYTGSEFDGVNTKWTVVEPRGFKGKWIWDRLSYNPAAAFRWQNLYDATGYDYNTDTDELVDAEELVVAHVVQRIIDSGPRKGEVTNNIEEYFEPTDENKALCTG